MPCFMFLYIIGSEIYIIIIIIIMNEIFTKNNEQKDINADARSKLRERKKV